MAVADASVEFADLKNIKSLNRNMVTEIENFFIDYNRHEGREFIPVSWEGAREAMQVVASYRTDVDSGKD